jgi:hypothetical protein
LRHVVQITGDGFRIKIDEFQRCLATTPHLQMVLSRYAVVLGMQIAQTAACNRLHDVGERLARWLLMAPVPVHFPSPMISWRPCWERTARA